MRRWLVALLVLLLGRRRRERPHVDDDRLLSEPPPRSRAELAVLALLAAATVCAGGFIAVYVLDRIPRQTQFLGLSLGLALAFLAAAALVTAKRLVPQDELAGPYPEERRGEDANDVVAIVAQSGDRLTRRRLLKLAAGGAGATLGAALLAPAVSLGPILEPGRLRRSPWRRGVRLVGSDGSPLRVDELDEKTFVTAFPEGADREQLGAPVVVVRLDPGTLELPHGRERWAPDGIVAYSKICTHAGCAVALYRTPLYEPTSARPALICPCHYSTFDPARGAAVMFGPAGRPLPQLPLVLAKDGTLVAAGSFSGAIGPSWWGVKFR
jgi:ubiquinol-cytochrome c reductase iron-sulfur subunit